MLTLFRFILQTIMSAQVLLFLPFCLFDLKLCILNFLLIQLFYHLNLFVCLFINTPPVMFTNMKPFFRCDSVLGISKSKVTLFGGPCQVSWSLSLWTILIVLDRLILCSYISMSFTLHQADYLKAQVFYSRLQLNFQEVHVSTAPIMEIGSDVAAQSWVNRVQCIFHFSWAFPFW